MMKTFKVLSVLLSYPTAEMQAAACDLGAVLNEEKVMPETCRRALAGLIDELTTGDLYDLQECYVLLFDRTRSLSLQLFEHVHGEGRDRGQAMIDLQNVYAAQGLEIGARELPDFLPLFLEFLSLRPDAEARKLLGQTVHILDALAERLRKRQSMYEAVFQALVGMAQCMPTHASAVASLSEPDVDPTDLMALDAAWEDQPVTFGPTSGDGCKDEFIARVRAANRPAPDLPRRSNRPILPTSLRGSANA